MSELEPIFRLLARRLAEQQPPRVHQPIALNELMDAILPYRLARRELGVDTVEDYETLLLRLAAGEGDYLQAEPAAQAALRAELARPLPDLALLRVWGDTHVVLRTEPLMTALDVRPEERYAPPGARSLQREQEEAEESPAEEDGEREEKPDRDAAGENAVDDAWVPDPVFEANAGVAEVMTTPQAPLPQPAPPMEPTAPPAATRCPFCGGTLPARMTINFCPHCGMGQDVGSCRACGADIDVGWRYCVNCGEDVQGGAS